MTLIDLQTHLDSIKMKHHDKYIHKKSFWSKVIVRSHIHTADRVHYTAAIAADNKYINFIQD